MSRTLTHKNTCLFFYTVAPPLPPLYFIPLQCPSLGPPYNAEAFHTDGWNFQILRSPLRHVSRLSLTVTPKTLAVRLSIYFHTLISFFIFKDMMLYLSIV